MIKLLSTLGLLGNEVENLGHHIPVQSLIVVWRCGLGTDVNNRFNCLTSQRGEPLKKELVALVTLLSILLVASTPMILAQQETSPPDVSDNSGVTPTLVTPVPGSAVGCQILYGYPTAFCQVNADGLITLPDGSTASVVVQPDGTSFIVDDEAF